MAAGPARRGPALPARPAAPPRTRTGPMRLLRLSLKAVGPFTDVELDLSAGHQGLHLIYGPNEAGKTSTLRALSPLLFGFPGRTPDDFVRPYDQLRVGGVLRHSDGEVLEFV